MGLRGNPCLHLSIYKYYVGHGKVCVWATTVSLVGIEIIFHFNLCVCDFSLNIYIYILFAFKRFVLKEIVSTSAPKSNKSLSLSSLVQNCNGCHTSCLCPKRLKWRFKMLYTNRIFPTCFSPEHTLYFISINQFRMVCVCVSMCCAHSIQCNYHILRN